MMIIIQNLFKLLMNIQFIILSKNFNFTKINFSYLDIMKVKCFNLFGINLIKFNLILPFYYLYNKIDVNFNKYTSKFYFLIDI